MSNPPKPTALRIIQGNPGKRPLPENEPQPTVKDKPPTPPRHLPAAAKKHWRAIAKHLHQAGVLTVMDEDALATYCNAYAQWVDANQQIQTEGMIIKSELGIQSLSPYLKISNEAFKQMAIMLREFGMTPSSRTRVTVAKKPTKSEWDEF